jgi:DNA uptake protein ComE-like DNA-binding protein
MEQMKNAIKGALVIAIAMAPAMLFPAALTQAPPQRVAVPESKRVDINLASVDELLRIPGMTRSWAGRVVRFRPYRSKQDLLDKGIVSGEVYNRIKDYIIAHRKDNDHDQ